MTRTPTKWIKPKPPVSVEFYDPDSRKYSYIDELDEIPTKKTIQRVFVPTYGPGKYRVIDSTTPESQSQTWTVAEDLRADHSLIDGSAPVQRQAISQEEVTQAAVAAALEQVSRYRAPAAPSYAPAPHAPAHHAPAAGPDPYTADVLRRLDTAMHQIQSHVMNLENQLSRLMFEVQQVPTRVGMDVRSAVQEAGDPEERVANLWAMLQDMQEGNIVGEDSTPSWLKALAPALGAMVPQPQLPQLPPSNGQAGEPAPVLPGAFGPLSSIPGIDSERAEAITVLCQMLGQPIELAAQLADRFGMDADALIAWGKEQVRTAQAAQAAETTGGSIETVPDTDRTGTAAGAGYSDPNGSEMGQEAGVPAGGALVSE